MWEWWRRLLWDDRGGGCLYDLGLLAGRCCAVRAPAGVAVGCREVGSGLALWADFEHVALP